MHRGAVRPLVLHSIAAGAHTSLLITACMLSTLYAMLCMSGSALYLRLTLPSARPMLLFDRRDAWDSRLNWDSKLLLDSRLPDSVG